MDFTRGNLSPYLEARFFQFYPADFSVVIYLFCTESFQDWFVFLLDPKETQPNPESFQNPPRDFSKKGRAHIR